jgi:predicted dienelactone hydrolase
VGTLAFTVADQKGEPLRVTAWYPAVAASGSPQPYLDPAERQVQAPAVARNFGWPVGVMRALGGVPTHSHHDARPASGRFPVVIFNHGLFGYPRQNTALMERLASQGYILLSLAHPGDAGDIPTKEGVLASKPLESESLSRLAPILAFWNGPDHAARVKAFPRAWDALRGRRMMNSLTRWRTDILRLTDALQARQLPAEASGLATAADAGRLAFAGMSFGGSASASACEFDRRCRAAINLDGFEFDQRLYDRKLRMPLLLIQSDWTTYPNMGPPSASHSLYDYAYERWARAGAASTIYRFRIAGVKHLGLTDLSLAPADPVRERMFGPADGRAVTSAVNDLVAAFLDRHVADKRSDPLAVAARHPIVTHHRATHIAQWHDR